MNIIGIDIGGTKISAGLITDGILVKTITQKTLSNGSSKEITKQLIDSISQLFVNQVAGIGIGVSSPVVIKTGMPFNNVNIPGINGIKLKSVLEKKFGVPVHVNNDANCFAIGEKFFGKGKKHENLIGLVIGTGLGSGIVINSKLYNGNNCAAGEFGEIAYLDKNIEYYCSSHFFQNRGQASGEILSVRATQGDREAIKIFKEYGFHLGKAIAVIVYALDPEMIILGGSISKSFSLFKNDLLQSLKEAIPEQNFKSLKIDVSSKKDIAILGAGALCL